MLQKRKRMWQVQIVINVNIFAPKKNKKIIYFRVQKNRKKQTL